MVDDRLVNIITEEFKKSDILDIVKNDKNFEKRIRGIVADVITDMYRVLWQHNSLFKALGKQ
jgi:hypothetical protein